NCDRRRLWRFAELALTLRRAPLGRRGQVAGARRRRPPRHEAAVELRSSFRNIAILLLAAAMCGQARAADPQLIRVAQEARQTIAVIDWFYLRHGACPQPSRTSELLALQSGLGDGFTLDLQGQFVAIRGISMSDVW